LSDPQSAVIRQLNAVNPWTFDSAALGGTVMADEHGVVRAKFFEEEPRERRSLASILLLQGEPPEGAREVRTDQFSVRTSASSLSAAPQQRITLVLDFVVAPGHHVYAPGAHRYRALGLRLKADELVRPHETTYPPARPYLFKPLQETVPVFEGSFRVTRDVTFGWSGTTEAFSVTIAGDLDYQVCSDRVCYPPSSVPLDWTLRILPFDQGRVPEAIRRKGAPR
jgi:hypothetical protein